MANTPVTIEVRLGPSTQQVRELALQNTEHEIELVLIVGGANVPVRIKDVRVSPQYGAGVGNSVNWKIVGTVITSDTRLAGVGSRMGQG